MEILISTDNNYIMPTGVLITSICENNKNENIRFHIFNKLLSAPAKNSIINIVNKYGKDLNFYSIDESIFKDFPIGRDVVPLPISTYYRLCMAKVLPKDMKKVLYLDCDMIVRHSLKDLWETNIENYAIGCVPDFECDDIIKYNRLRYPLSYGYFNAGMLLVNLQRWRDEDLFSRFVEFAVKHNDRILQSDQDVLNYVLRKEKMDLRMKYNVQDGLLLSYPLIRISWTREEEISEAISDPVIFHFCGTLKPWFKDCNSPYKDEFIKYLKLTEWSNISLKSSPKTVKQKLRIILRYIGLIKDVRIQYKKIDV